MGRLLALVAALIAASAIAWTVQQPPKPLSASAPATAFSADRAMSDIKVFAAVPHPIGTAANHTARDYLLRRMTALGLAPQVHAGVGLMQPKSAKDVLLGGQVENLVGVLPGRDRTAPAMALMSHYDSVPASSGAADDGAGAAAALEIVRALKTGGPPARDVIVLITDGEEVGLLGASAFFRDDPMAKRIGYLFNMDVRGDAGRTLMFQTGPGAGGSIDLYRQTANRPQATSLAAFVAAKMPNDTDFTVSHAAGLPGMNYGFIGRQFDYHSPSSTPATLDPGTLQDLGQQVLGPARKVAFGPLPAAGPEQVFGQVFGNLVLAYPPAMGWLLLAATAILMALAIVRARRVEPFPWTDVAHGAGAGLFALIGVVTVLHFARRATGAHFGFIEQRVLLAQAPRWELALFLLGLGFLLAAASEIGRGRRQIAVLPLAAGLGASLFGGFDPVGLGMGVAAALVGAAAYGRPVSRPGAWAGVLTLGLIVSTAAQVAAPATGLVAAWPLALAALAAALTDLSTRRGVVVLVVLVAAAATGVGWLAGYVHLAYLSLDLVELLALGLLGVAMVLWPLAQPAEGAPPERLIGPAMIIVGLAVTVAVRVNDPYNARFPQASIVVYQQDQDARRAWLVSDTLDRPAWATTALKASGKIQPLTSWLRSRPVDAAPAPYVPEPAPQISLTRQADGTLLLRAVPPPGGRDMSLGLTPNTPVTIESVQGVPARMQLAPGHLGRIRWAAAPQGLSAVLRPGGPGALVVDYNARMDSWPAGIPPLPARPANVMAFGDSDTTYLTGERRLAW